MPVPLVTAGEHGIVFSNGELLVIAIGCGIALAIAMATLPMVSPRTRRPLGPGARVAVGLLTPIVCALFVLARSARGNDQVADALWIYIFAMLSLVIPRVVFARWFKRVAEAQLAGEPIQTSGGKAAVLFLGSMAIVIGSLVALLTWLPRLWA